MHMKYTSLHIYTEQKDGWIKHVNIHIHIGTHVYVYIQKENFLVKASRRLWSLEGRRAPACEGARERWPKARGHAWRHDRRRGQ